jgi:hypothetical protein
MRRLFKAGSLARKKREFFDCKPSNLQKREMRYANAGHPHPLHFTRAANGSAALATHSPVSIRFLPRGEDAVAHDTQGVGKPDAGYGDREDPIVRVTIE